MNNLDNCPHYLGNQPKIGFDRNVNIRFICKSSEILHSSGKYYDEGLKIGDEPLGRISLPFRQSQERRV